MKDLKINFPLIIVLMLIIVILAAHFILTETGNLGFYQSVKNNKIYEMEQIQLKQQKSLEELKLEINNLKEGLRN